MTRETKKIRVLAKAPDARGTFEGEILYNPPDGDHDGERIENWTNLPAVVPLQYQHAIGDPYGVIGVANALEVGDGRRMKVLGRLDLGQPIADAVYERMLLPSNNVRVLKELSVGFEFDRAKAFEDANGVWVLRDVELTEISVVWAGAQSTSITGVKLQRQSLGERLERAARQSGVRDARLIRRLRARADGWRGYGDPEAFKRVLYEVVDQYTAPGAAELTEINARLDALLEPTRPKASEAAVDAFVTGIREELNREALDRAEQAAWEEGMRINVVLDPVPVRVDARMRPVAS